MSFVSLERFKPVILYLITSRRSPIVSFDKNKAISVSRTGIQTLLLIFLVSSYPLCSFIMLCISSPQWLPVRLWQSIKKQNFFFNLLLYLHLDQTCLLESTPLHSLYTALNVLSSYGTCFVGWSEGPVSNFLLSPLPSEIGDLLVRISTSGTRKSPQGPNLESRATGGQQSTHASSKILG